MTVRSYLKLSITSLIKAHTSSNGPVFIAELIGKCLLGLIYQSSSQILVLPSRSLNKNPTPSSRSHSPQDIPTFLHVLTVYVLCFKQRSKTIETPWLIGHCFVIFPSQLFWELDSWNLSDLEVPLPSGNSNIIWSPFYIIQSPTSK